MWFHNFWNWITHIFTIYRLYKVQNSSCFTLTILIPLFTMRLVFSKDKKKTKGIMFTMPACSLKVFLEVKNGTHCNFTIMNPNRISTHCAIMKVNEKKLSKCQFHFPRLLVACPKLKKWKKNFCPDGQLR